MRRMQWLGALLGVATVFSGVLERDASACGGVFLPPTENETVVNDHRMLLAISKLQTTLYDQIAYSGSPSSFAWVLPIKGHVTVGLSSDILFETMDSLTATQVSEPSANCPSAPSCDDFPSAHGGGAEDAGAAGDAGGGGGVTVTAQKQVGPYETVQLHSSDGNGGSVNTWLLAHGFSVPPAVAPIIASYVADQFDFLAMKLVPGASVKAMRPVRVTTDGASPVLPLRMVAAGTGATTGITLWVVGEGRYQPQNFPFFTITDSELAWDWTTNSSNYESVRLTKEAALGGKGWQVESSLEINQYSISSTLLQSVEFSSDGGSYPSALDGGPAPGLDAGSTDGGFGDAGENPAAEADLATLFAGISGGNVRVTRMRTDIAHSALGVDLQLEAASDKSELTNVYSTTSQVGQPLCPIFQGCTQVGQVPRDQAVAASEAGSVGCNAARVTSHSDFILVGFAGFVGLGAVRWRRKGRSSRS
jgi:hypothetical protein